MFVLSHDTELEDLGNGIKRKVLAHDSNLMSVEVHFDAGSIGALHSHPHEQLTYVLSGKFEFVIGDEKRIVCAGDTMYKRPNIEHGCKCLEEGVLLDIFTPRRNDFLTLIN
ncbi:cupin domain-containing protein [Vibrio sonorensis]|uniref:cupin domain-containing protein n=1 Tax=Vibrio sonorensis TaxID=1004316 RepID=UPI0008DA51FB|nr:cupin domain-containing protein [Vibrio sonorensis]